MGLRLYSPATGRFLQTDPVSGASANGYDYCNGDPVNCTDLDGQCPKFISHPIASAACKAATKGTEYLIDVAGEAFCAAVLTEILPVCSGIVIGTSSAASYFVETRWDGGFSWATAIEDFVIGAIAGGIGGAVANLQDEFREEIPQQGRKTSHRSWNENRPGVPRRPADQHVHAAAEPGRVHRARQGGALRRDRGDARGHGGVFLDVRYSGRVLGRVSCDSVRGARDMLSALMSLRHGSAR
ncbi:MAG: hypothetical protein JWO67_4466 [Streptosporangiaceae bacterium]|nr:hypothetical protein [Streptosporangiaceae bacterium]